MNQALLLTFVLSPVALADSWIVATDGSGDYLTIGEAVTAASSGDEIRVRAGTYPEVINLQGLDLTIRRDAVSDVVVIDGLMSKRCVVADSMESSATSFIGLIFRDGDTSGQGGCVYISNASPSFTQCTFDGCESLGGGGGVFVSNGSPSFTDCVWMECAGEDGGGLRVEDGSGASVVNIDDSRFASNYASDGEAISSSASTPPIVTGTVMCDHYQGYELEGVIIDGGQNEWGTWCCRGDVDWDGDVDTNDLLLQVTAFGNALISGDDREDVTRDEVVDLEDLLLLLAHWGSCV
ncbi:MAG: hypothetical protein MK077_10345 [Phycisphaerales bacterium]|nr:hypothetical protein [Phycisphaerales bacterium]